jgi:ornithine cyclodeaminase/alanine dehydrogenase-like protein (mu-crystallin family)
VRTVQGNGASRRTLQEAGVTEADLVVITTARDEVNLVSAMLVKPGHRVVIISSPRAATEWSRRLALLDEESVYARFLADFSGSPDDRPQSDESNPLTPGPAHGIQLAVDDRRGASPENLAKGSRR